MIQDSNVTIIAKRLSDFKIAKAIQRPFLRPTVDTSELEIFYLMDLYKNYHLKMSSIYILLEPKALLADLFNSWKPKFAPPESCTQKWTLTGSSVDYDGSLKKHKSHFPCKCGEEGRRWNFLLSLLSIYLLLSSSCKSNRRNIQWSFKVETSLKLV